MPQAHIQWVLTLEVRLHIDPRAIVGDGGRRGAVIQIKTR